MSLCNLDFVKPFDVTLDRLTLVGTIHNDYYFDLLINGNNILWWISQQDAIFDRAGILLPELKERGSAFFNFNTKTKKIRFEFNPKYARDNVVIDRVYRTFIKQMNDVHISRMDVALDYEFDFFKYKILDLKPNRIMKPYIKNGKIETIEFGVRSSSYNVVIYDKLKERKAKLTEEEFEKLEFPDEWKRVEIRLNRSSLIDEVLDDWSSINPFDGIILIQNVRKDDFDNVKDWIVAKAIIEDSSLMDELSKNMKTKFRKIISSLSKDQINFETAWKKAKSPIFAEIRDWTKESQKSIGIDM